MPGSRKASEVKNAIAYRGANPQIIYLSADLPAILNRSPCSTRPTCFSRLVRAAAVVCDFGLHGVEKVMASSSASREPQAMLHLVPGIR